MDWIFKSIITDDRHLGFLCIQPTIDWLLWGGGVKVGREWIVVCLFPCPTTQKLLSQSPSQKVWVITESPWECSFRSRSVLSQRCCVILFYVSSIFSAGCESTGMQPLVGSSETCSGTCTTSWFAAYFEMITNFIYEILALEPGQQKLSFGLWACSARLRQSGVLKPAEIRLLKMWVVQPVQMT